MRMTNNADIEPILRDVMTELQKELREELRAQGHRLSGKLEQSIQYEIETAPGKHTARMFYEDYGVFIDFGVKLDRIPYGGGQRSGGRSLYIEGLINFWEQRGLSGRDAVGAAFATANVQKREGMPTRASYRFSNTGERTGFSQTVIDRNLDKISKIIEDKYGAVLELRFADDFNRTIRLTA